MKTDHELALGLYETGISDAMYLAGLIADDSRMTKKDLQGWVKKAHWSMLSEFTVPGRQRESARPRAGSGVDRLQGRTDRVRRLGDASSLVATKDDEELDIPELKRLLDRVQKTIHNSQTACDT